jgi:hypothetical protein
MERAKYEHTNGCPIRYSCIRAPLKERAAFVDESLPGER